MSPILFAFLIGLLSACSLPLGAMTAAVWKPGGRTIAFLMSFGSGALLAALTIDLAGPAVEEGHFYPLAVGCVMGGTLFVILNQVVNQHGGFLRKASTTIFYLRGLRRRRNRKLVTSMRRLDVFSQLPAHDLRELADGVKCRAFKAGETVFYSGDPARYFCIVESGEIALRQNGDPESCQALRTNDAFGHKAFFTGLRHNARAVAKTDSMILIVPRRTLLDLLKSSAELRTAAANYLSSEELADYLVKAQRTPASRASEWTREATAAVLEKRELPPLVDGPMDRRFAQHVKDVHRAPFFAHLSDFDVRELASRVFTMQIDKGHTLFYQGEPADRMYIVESGVVALLDAQAELRSASQIVNYEAFGTMSFLTGTRHASTAVSASPTSVWVLARIDFEELLECCPNMAHAVQEFLKKEDVSSYLQKKHHFDFSESAAWVSRAVHSMDLGRLIPPAGELRAELDVRHGAPLAIWLGILLDGIPESLVIGSSMLHTSVSWSLIAGLFLSNYPEALSSSIGMQEQGMKWPRVMLMWTSLMVITGIGAALGNLFFREAPESLISLVEGIAAGAMLTMIAETMLPEAYFKGGNVVGFSTLLGFLAAIFFKTLE